MATPLSNLLLIPELMNVLIKIADDSYGGVLAALVATFLSNTMNSDPQVVHFVHSSGLANSFLSTNKSNGREESLLAPSAELIMAIPNLIVALSLTEAGANAVAEANPSLHCFQYFAVINMSCPTAGVF